MKLHTLYFSVLFALFIIACSSPQNTSKELVEMDLSTHGIPVKLKVPKGANVSEGIMNTKIDEYRIYNLDINQADFKLTLYMNDEEPIMNLKDKVSTEKKLAEEFNNNVEWLLEEENGFIYSFNNDGIKNYGFSYIIEKNNRFIIFQTGTSFNEYTHGQVEELYHSAKSSS